MSNHPEELAELRRRVEQLEQQVRALTEATADPRRGSLPPRPTPPPPPPLPLPSLAQPVEDRPPRVPAPAQRSRELDSTVVVAAIGGFIFLLGAIYALTVSIQRGWISPPVRVALGIMVGSLLAGGAVRLIAHERRRLGLALLTVGLGTATFACYYGGLMAHVFDRSIGFGGAVLATVAAGATAARYRLSGAMVAANALAVVAPLVFLEPRLHETMVLAYFVAVLAAQAAAYYLTGTGAQWRVARWVGLGVLAGVATAHVEHLNRPQSGLGLGLLIVSYVVSLVITWLPRHPERPAHVVTLTASLSVIFALGLHVIGTGLGWSSLGHAVPLALLAALLVGLIPWARQRLSDHSADTGLAVCAAGFSIAAVLMVLDDAGSSLLWGAVALAAALAARHGPASERQPLTSAAVLYLLLATPIWMGDVTRALPETAWPFLNTTWLGGVIVAAAWWQLGGASQDPSARRVGWFIAQVIFVHGLAMEWVGRQSAHLWPDMPMAALLGTLTYALAGLGQWYAGVRTSDASRARPLRIAGYVWLGLAVAKLFFIDLDRASTESRAIAALILGGLFIAAALLVDRLRPERTKKP
ncbi:DUF2339 domain-containing protein [Synoicihabitans lomoniglobus]|uniref:DUF2339 domain-containing protein n=1 Tax=Synoicihabitans lomoniglobus TaxID=2909285 RepID=A0AAE9ZXQ1_9BACT|nr:DUF2339 domain-containing protein [Opitutaceae bacterium LMO-M01]WED65214.1 DUF2339 domain-containing protein [Opitutaceae bacterium LMO-M01]